MNNLLPRSIKAQDREKDQDKGDVTSCGLSKIPGLNEMDALTPDETAAARTMPYAGQMICGTLAGSGIAGLMMIGGGNPLLGVNERQRVNNFFIVLGGISSVLSVFYFSHQYKVFSTAAKNQADQVSKFKTQF